jgi:hypothetical protein
MRKIGLLLALLGASVAAWATNPPSILNNTDHISNPASSSSVTAALTALGITWTGTPSSSVLTVSQTCPTGTTAGVSCFAPGGPTFLPPATIIANAQNLSTSEYAPGSATSVTPLTPYYLINQSSTGYQASYDQANYPALVAGSMAYSMAYCGFPLAGDQPPVAFVTALPNQGVGPTPIPSNVGGVLGSNCGYAQGIEFSVPTTCSATDCQFAFNSSIEAGSPSATEEGVTAILAALKSANPTWTWGDIKGALRQTASNWATGYAVTTGSGSSVAFGYGNISYSSAAAISGTSSIYLQPPSVHLANAGAFAQIIVYPFLQTRRTSEVIYAFTSAPTWPSYTTGCSSGPCNEYTYSQLAAIASSYGGTRIAQTSGGVTPTFIYYPPSSGTYYFVVFTTDATGALGGSEHYSRGELFSAQSAALTVSTSCVRQ